MLIIERFDKVMDTDAGELVLLDVEHFLVIIK